MGRFFAQLHFQVIACQSNSILGATSHFYAFWVCLTVVGDPVIMVVVVAQIENKKAKSKRCVTELIIRDIHYFGTQPTPT